MYLNEPIRVEVAMRDASTSKGARSACSQPKVLVWVLGSLIVEGLLLIGIVTPVIAPGPTETFDAVRIDPPKTSVGWIVEIVDSGLGRAFSPSIAFDSKDSPHLAYGDQYNDELKYAYLSGGLWRKEFLITSWISNGIPIDFDSEDSPHIAYYNLPYESLFLARNITGSWTFERAAGPGMGAGDYGFFPDMVIDADNVTHLTYYMCDQVISKYCVHVHQFRSWNETNWTIGGGGGGIVYLRVEDFFDYFGTSMALDSTNRLHIASFDRTEIGYSYYDGVSWQHKTFDCDEPYGAKGVPSLALDSNDVPHISFFWDIEDVPMNLGQMMYATKVGGSWVCSNVYSGETRPSSLVIDSKDRPHIFYSYNDYLKHARFDGYWKSEIVDPEPTTSTKSFLSAAFDDHNVLHVVYAHKNATTHSVRHAFIKGPILFTPTLKSSDDYLRTMESTTRQRSSIIDVEVSRWSTDSIMFSKYQLS